MRCCVLSVLLLLALASSASAQTLWISGGAGQMLLVSDPCGYDDCEAEEQVERLRVTEWSPIVAGGALLSGGRLRMPAEGLSARIGGRVELATVGPRAGYVAAQALFGFELGPLSADIGMGLGTIWLDQEGRDERSASLSLGATAAVRLAPTVALTGRATANTMMHQSLNALFAGVTLDWSPALPLL